MYDTLLVVHNLVRWVVLLAGVLALARAARGAASGAAWTRADGRTAAMFTGAVHLQLLLGLTLYAVSPVTRKAIGDLAAAMRDPAARFVAVEHPALMLVAVALATAAGPVSRRGLDDRARFRRLALLVGLALVAIAAGIPWAKPLVRGL